MQVYLARVFTSGLVLFVCAASPSPPVRAQDLQPPGVEPARPRPQIHLVGAAEVLSDRLRLTPSQPQTVGAAWFAPQQPLSAGFEAVFRFQITEPRGLGPGADGFAFVMQNQGLNALAGRGSAGGFAIGDGWHDPKAPGIPRSVAVFFDTYQNDDAHDPSDNYVAICTNGPISQMRWPPSRLGVGRKLRIRLKDGRVHTARIRYKPPMMAVYFDDGEPVVRVPVDLSPVMDAAGAAYVGFTASTGNGYENHDILDWAFTPDAPNVTSDMFVVQSTIRFLAANCLEGRNLCTPRDATVEEKAPGHYHVVLPAHIEWGASIPNPDAVPIAISNAHGSVCWPDANGGAQECGGPDGVADINKHGARGTLLDAGHNPGALVSKNEKGRTWFSVNGRQGRDFKPGFKDNQGFFEFDVRVN